MPRYQPPPRRDAIPPGEYEVRVVKATEEISSNGSDMISLRLRVEPGKFVFEHIVFSEAAAWKIAEFLSAFGEDVSGEKDIHAIDYIGRTARVRLTSVNYRGQEENKVAKWLPKTESIGEKDLSLGSAEELGRKELQ